MNTLILLNFVFVCALSDLRTKKIPNSLILCGLSGALLARGFSIWLSCSVLLPEGGPPAVCQCFLAGFLDGLAGFLLPWLLLGALAALKMLGGGDVKLLSVIGLWLGAKLCLTVIWYSLLAAALWSAVLVIRRRNLMRRLLYLYRYIGILASGGGIVPYRSGGGDSSGEFCFALPVFLALSVCISKGGFL